MFKVIIDSISISPLVQMVNSAQGRRCTCGLCLPLSITPTRRVTTLRLPILSAIIAALSPTDSPFVPMRFLSRALQITAAMLCLSALVLHVLLTVPLYVDDAYMFVRYARNLLSTGVIAWNPDGISTYGLTSLLYLAPVTALVALFPAADPTHSATAASMLGMALFLALVIGGVAWFAPTGARWTAVLAVMFGLAWGAPYVAIHAASGMDTTFGWAALALYLWLALHAERQPTRARLMAAGMCGGLLFAARPDVMLYGAIIPCVWWLAHIAADVRRGGRAWRRWLGAAGLRLGIISAGTLLALVGWAWQYFGTPLPLPFYAKSGGIYGPDFEALYAHVPLEMFGAYVWLFLPLFGLALVAAVRPRAWWAQTSAVEKGIALATLVALVYHGFFVLHIMGYAARFYMATLPALLWLAARGALVLWDAAQTWLKPMPAHATPAPRLWLVLNALIALALFGRVAQVPMWEGLRPSGWTMLHEAAQGPARLAAASVAERASQWDNYLFRIGQFAALPAQMSIATSEVGLPSVLTPQRTIIDIAGLNSTRFALQGFNADALLGELRPDVMFMPYPDYRTINQAIMRSPALAAYDFYAPSVLGTAMGVAIRRESHYYAEATAIIDQALQARGLPADSATLAEYRAGDVVLLQTRADWQQVPLFGPSEAIAESAIIRVTNAMPSATLSAPRVWWARVGGLPYHIDVAPLLDAYAAVTPAREGAVYTVSEYRRMPPLGAGQRYGAVLTLHQAQINGVGNQARIAACQIVEVETWWTAQGVSADYALSIALLNPQATSGVLNVDAALAGTPTRTWPPDRAQVDVRSIALPCDLPAGEYPLVAIVYDYPTQTRVTLADGAGWVVIGWVRVG
jgi:hypothetical protein